MWSLLSGFITRLYDITNTVHGITDRLGAGSLQDRTHVGLNRANSWTAVLRLIHKLGSNVAALGQSLQMFIFNLTVYFYSCHVR